MVKIEITSNDAGQRLDRFLRKYLKRAPLSGIYRIIRKDLKVNGRREKEDYVLRENDELFLYISDDKLAELTRPVKKHTAKKQFRIAYEDEAVLIVEKPWGLLTHGDSHEKKNTLMNQVCGYLQEKGEYDPAEERSFTPSPVNRLDRNTTGLVIFGKTAEALRQLTKLIRQRNLISKYYLTIVAGNFREEMAIEHSLEKDSVSNTVHVAETGQHAKSVARPVAQSRDGKFSVVEVELVTGRTHQIRAHLSAEGFPLVGDSKYGRSSRGRSANETVRKLGVTTQLLHACRLEFGNVSEEYPALANLNGMEIRAVMPSEFERIWKELKIGQQRNQ